MLAILGNQWQRATAFSGNVMEGCLPIACRMDLVQILATLLTEVFVGRTLFGENTDASTMLPDFADIALDEKSRYFVRQLDASKEVGLWIVLSLFRILLERWRARVFVEATDTSYRLVVLLNVVTPSSHIVRIDTRLVAGVLLGASSAA